MSARLYVGLKPAPSPIVPHEREVFRASDTPTERTHGARFKLVIGPFRTRRAADLCAGNKWHAPTLITVADYERIARGIARLES